MPQLSIATFGALQITVDGVAPAFDYAKVRALLLYLAVEQRRPHARESLAELLWPEQEPGAGRNSLRRALAALRASIGDHAADPPFLLAGRETVQFNPRGAHTLDSARFTALVEGVAQHAHPRGQLCPACQASLEEAAALYRGPFAEGALPRGCPELEAWALARREWFERHALDALDALAELYAGQGHHERALAYAQAQLALDAWREPAHRQAMRALAAQGLRSAALAQYEQCARLLAADLGADPEPETAALAEAIRRNKLGGQAAPPPLAPAPAPPAPRLALPASATSLIGRDEERRELAALIADPSCRLLSLLGPGGIGKTRLALQIAADVGASFADGVCWVALAGLPAAEQLPDALAQALGCAPKGGGDLRAALRDWLQPRQLLLLVDSFEHLLDGAWLLDELLAAAPRLTIVATSRERLQLQREWLYDLGGLPFPLDDDEDRPATPAVQLFMERARQVRRVSALPADERRAALRIARSTEGMPLALELAAAASRDRAFVAIAEALARNIDLLRTSVRDVPERHRSVRAAIDHSWQLLDPPQRHALALLSLFRGGFTLEAAAQVAGADEGLLASLQDKSLLRWADGRYDIHELVRQFAYSQLVESGVAEAGHRAHLGSMAELAELAEPELLGAEQAPWLERLEIEHANFRAALRWAIDGGEPEGAARIAGSLWRFWWMRGHLAEGRRWLDEILARPGQVAPPVLARAERGAGSLANQQGDYQSARDHHSVALELERQLGNRRGLANQLGSLARVETNLRNYGRARALIEEGLQIHRELGNEVGFALLTDALAGVAYNEGDSAQAARLYAEALALHRARGDRHSIAIGLHNLSDLAFERGDLRQALAGARECLTLFRELGHKLGVGAALHLIAAVARVEGDYAQAAAAEREALELYYGIGNWRIVAVCLVGAAAIAAGQRHWDRAAQLCGAAEQLRGTAELPPPDRALYAATLASAAAALGVEEAARAEWRGRALDAAAAVALARSP
jgi:predicted ATPase/DNA-binding SARP family transcriptional activator